MYTKDDINYLNSLKRTNPDIYERITSIYSRLQSDVRKGCHDLRNIITLISGSYQLIELDDANLSGNERWLQMGSDIDFLVASLDAISKYRYASVLQTRKVNTYEYVWQLQEELSAINGVCPNISVSIPPTVPPISIDTDKISYVIKALITNIIDECSDASITLSIDYGADNLYIRIADELDGFNAETGGAIFELFNSDKQNHIGLSLATSYRILLAHRGELSYSKNTPNGSIFTLSLPIAP
ncbi:MAG: HAMP domain-containing histidine kinase [Butyrivibrio sp.]|nr:HAMP domain-containing histidine kinase [Butyrivibrio sp.]